MLRTQGVPARIVKGFHGCEASGDGGYRVRHSMAHAWAEVLVPRKEPGPAYDWLSLDPSPSGDRVITTAAADWWQDKTKAGASVWQNLIVGFNAEKQAGVLEAAAGPFLAYQTAFIEDLPYFVRPFIGFILAGVGWYAYSAWKRWNAKRIRRPPAFPLFKTVQTVARLHGGPTYNTGQTPLEYAEKVRTWQMGQSLAIERVDVPRRVAELLYRVRFGDHIAGAGELTQLQEQVQLWSADLRSAARG